MDEAFDASGHGHALLANLATLTDDGWRWKPEGRGRSIAEIAGLQARHFPLTLRIPAC